MSRITSGKYSQLSFCKYKELKVDNYVFCTSCQEHVFEYCSIHGPLLRVIDNKVPEKHTFPSFVPRAALTIPDVFLHLAPSTIPGAGIGVFATVCLPPNVSFGPYRGKITQKAESNYCWQIYDNGNPSHTIDASDANKSNWMRYVNCSRHWCEQNLVAFEYRGQIYYRTIKPIPRFTELLVFYGVECALKLNIDMKRYQKPLEANLPNVYSNKLSNSGDIDELNLSNSKTSRHDTERSLEYLHLLANQTQQDLSPKNSIDKQKCCDQCHKLFSSNSSLKRHMSTHTGEKLFACEICHTKFACVRNLKRHMRIHTGEKPFGCAFCQKKFGRNSSLKAHMRTHTDEKPFTCETCQTKFACVRNLKTHMRIHTGEKPFGCAFCQKKFGRNSSLKAHMRTHTDEKPFTCETCQTKFACVRNLKTHMRIHTGEKPFGCTICQRKFGRNFSLKAHMRTHTGEKPFICETCQTKFASVRNLKRHMRIHTGEKPFTCETCQTKFATGHNLKRHNMNIHRGGKNFLKMTP